MLRIPFYTKFYGNPCKKVFDSLCAVQWSSYIFCNVSSKSRCFEIVAACRDYSWFFRFLLKKEMVRYDCSGDDHFDTFHFYGRFSDRFHALSFRMEGRFLHGDCHSGAGVRHIDCAAGYDIELRIYNLFVYRTAKDFSLSVCIAFSMSIYRMGHS